MISVMTCDRMASTDNSLPSFHHTDVIPVAHHESAMPSQPPLSPSSQESLRTLEGEPICRICLDRGTEPLVSPCKCAGSAKFAHESCLLQWFFKTRRRRCELCLSEVNVKSVGFKPLQKWRLPTDSCDFVFYLFTLYCVIMFVFTGMIIWIATQGCLSPVCITLYVICTMSLVYFIYCCGCVEYSKTYWKACVTTNKNWRIYNREESSRTKMKATRVVSNGSESVISKKSDHCAVSIPQSPDGASAGSVVDRASYLAGDQSLSSMHGEEHGLSGSTTLVYTYHEAEDTRRIEVMSPQITSSMNSSPSSLSPLSFGREMAHAGSISLLMELNYYTQQGTCNPITNCKAQPNGKDLGSNVDDGFDHDDRVDSYGDNNGGDGGDNEFCGGDLESQRTGQNAKTKQSEETINESSECIVKPDGFTNKGFDDTKL